MKTRTVNHDHHPLYQKYDRALSEWRQAKKLWYAVVNNKATPEQKTEFATRLREADHLFKSLAQQNFLSAESYVRKIAERYLKLSRMERYAAARKLFLEASNLKGKSQLVQKRELYERAWDAFLILGDYPGAELYAKKAEENYFNTFNADDNDTVGLTLFQAAATKTEVVPPVAVKDDSKEEMKTDNTTQAGPWKVLIEGGYDVCIRSKLPSPDRELPTTTIITSDGAFQLGNNQRYMRVLEPAALQDLQLGHYVTQAKNLGLEWFKRKSIRSELNNQQLQTLGKALAFRGGHDLEESVAARPAAKP